MQGKGLKISITNTNKILTPTGGYLEGYTHSLNPYIGCAFACTYCYVKRLPVALFQKEEWGSWLKIKENAAEQLAKEIKRYRLKERDANTPLRLFMASSTDPYQPLEYQTNITRSLLKVLVENQDVLDQLFIQTRSPLVTRDIDLMKQLGNKVMVSITIETDLESVRKIMTPAAPPIQARFKSVKRLYEHGINVQAAVSPILPHSEDFPLKLKGIINRVCLDDYFVGDGQSGKKEPQDWGLKSYMTTMAGRIGIRLKRYMRLSKPFYSILKRSRFYCTM